MFIAELLCLIIYVLHQGLTASKKSLPSPALKYKLLFCISGTFDMFNFLFSVFGLTMAAASVYQMLYGGTLFWTFVFSIIYLKRRYHRQHFFAVSLLLLGLVTVGLAGVIWSEKATEGTPTKAIGVIMIMVGQVFSAMQNVVQEKIFSQHNINPMQATGIEGSTGIIYSAILLPIFNVVVCTPQIDSEGNAVFCPFGYLEDTGFAIRQILANRYLALYVLGYTISTVFFNSIGISIVKYTSSMQRSVINCLRIFMVWIVSLIIGWEKFILLQFIGFVMIVFGMLIFSELLILPFWGFNRHLTSLSKNEKESVLMLSDSPSV